MRINPRNMTWLLTLLAALGPLWFNVAIWTPIALVAIAGIMYFSDREDKEHPYRVWVTLGIAVISALFTWTAHAQTVADCNELAADLGGLQGETLSDWLEDVRNDEEARAAEAALGCSSMFPRW